MWLFGATCFAVSVMCSLTCSSFFLEGVFNACSTHAAGDRFTFWLWRCVPRHGYTSCQLLNVTSATTSTPVLQNIFERFWTCRQMQTMQTTLSMALHGAIAQGLGVEACRTLVSRAEIRWDKVILSDLRGSPWYAVVFWAMTEAILTAHTSRAHFPVLSLGTLWHRELQGMSMSFLVRPHNCGRDSARSLSYIVSASV